MLIDHISLSPEKVIFPLPLVAPKDVKTNKALVEKEAFYVQKDAFHAELLQDVAAYERLSEKDLWLLDLQTRYPTGMILFFKKKLQLTSHFLCISKPDGL